MASSSRAWQAATLIFLTVIGVRLYVVFTGPGTVDTLAVDDALITYRYAENIGDGRGFVYNPGERVLGTTTPLYTFLLAFFASLGASLPLVSLILGLLASGLTGATLYFYARSLKLGALAAGPGLLYAIWPNAILADISGLEVPLFTAGVSLFFYFVLRGRYRDAALSCGILALIRPEGALLVLLLFLFKYMIKERKFLLEAAIVAALTLPWALFAWGYFGSPIPNSIAAKLALYSGFDTGSLLERLYRLLSLQSLLGWLVFLGWLWGLAYLMMRHYWGWLETLYMSVTLFALSASGANLFFWYKAPLAPLYTLFIGAGVAGALRLALDIVHKRRYIWSLVVLVILAAIPTFGAQVERTRRVSTEQAEIYRGQHQRAGRYLTENAESEDIVVAEDIGYLGYEYRGRIIDRDGLVSPEAIPFNRALGYSDFLKQQLAQNPGHWLLVTGSSPTSSELISSGVLQSRYVLIEDFALRGSQDYLLYRALRKAPAP